MSLKVGLVALLAISVVLGGCAGTSPPATDTTTEECPLSSIAYWSGDEYRGWAPDTIRVGYSVSGPADLLLVVYENDTVLGVRHSSPKKAVSADGAPIHLDQPLTGNHTIRVSGYTDTNQNGKFDPQTDTPCSVTSAPLTLNFSALNTTTTTYEIRTRI